MIFTTLPPVFPRLALWFRAPSVPETAKAVIAVGVLGLLSTVPVQAEEGFSVKWAGLDVAPVSQLGSDLRIVFVSGLPGGSLVADANSTPPNPFKNGESALYVNATDPDTSWFRLEARPFVDAPPKQGQIEFEFCVLSGSVGIILGSNNLPWSADARDSYAVTEAQVSVTMTPGNRIMVRGREFFAESIDVIEEGKNYTLLVKWDFEGNPNAPFALYLNGERLTSPSEAAAFRIPENPELAGINAFRLALGSSENPIGVLFLGRIAASGGPVELASPSGRLDEQ